MCNAGYFFGGFVLECYGVEWVCFSGGCLAVVFVDIGWGEVYFGIVEVCVGLYEVCPYLA